MTPEEFAEMLKSKEVKDAMGDKKSFEDILEDIDITEDDTIETVSKKFQKQLKDVVKHFSSVIEETKKSAIEEATKPAEAARQQEIIKFKAENPGMKSDALIAIMDPLYISGMSLEDSYAKACKALDMDPKTGKVAGEETEEEKAAREKEAAAEKAKGKAKTSLKSNIPEDDDEGVEKKKEEPVTLRDSIKANMNRMKAEGATFGEKKEGD